ncbi:MAG: Bug family tripartite tricarboxylate transporter substrate binding protein [Xanthobacteraceae bacterium]
MRKFLPAVALAVLMIVLPTGGPAVAQTAADFKGETIGINIGFPPGGSYDPYFRVLARHYGRFIPGNPIVIAKNMPGAGSLRAANYIYNVAPRDGTELATFSVSTAMEPLMGNEQAKFDAGRFGWIGSLSEEINFCGAWQRPGAVSSFQDMLTRETILGAPGPAATSYQHPLVLKNVLGAKVRLVTGYKGVQDTYLAMQRGEANGVCGLSLTAIKLQRLADVEQGRLKLIIQMGPKTTSVLGRVPSVFDYAKTDEDRKVLEFHFYQRVLGRPLTGPPGIPPARLTVLRKAFQDTMRDPAFLADAKRTHLDIDPATGERVEQLLRQFAAYPKAVIDRAKAAIGR